MSIASELSDLTAYLLNAYDMCEELGATMPEHKNMYNLAACINSIFSGPNAITTEDGKAIFTEDNNEIDFESVPYTMLDWIESTGTQYIDTGIMPSNSIKVETKLSLINPAYCGSEKTPNDGRFKWGTNGQNNIYYGYGTQNHNISATIGLNIPYTYYMARGEQWVKNESGTTIASSTDTSITTYSTTPILLFALMSSGSITYSNVMRIYYCKIWNGDTLVRDFIPVLDETNQTPCLYDKVTETYFYNQGTGDFVTPITNHTTLNYLRSTGTQYIDTGLLTNSDIIFETNLKFIGGDSNSWIPLYGSRTSSSNTSYHFGVYVQSSSHYITPNYAGFDPRFIRQRYNIIKYAVHN